jgi:hypothetical protein
MKSIGPGSKLKGYVCAHGERLIEGTLAIENRITPSDLPKPMSLPIFHIRHFPSIVPGIPPAVLELVRLKAENIRYSEELWVGQGTLRFFSSELEEHMPLAPKEDHGRLPFQFRLYLPRWRDTPPVGLEEITELPWSHLICGICNTRTRTGSAACDVKTAWDATAAAPIGSTQKYPPARGIGVPNPL